MSEIPKKVGVTDFVSEIEPVENYPDFEKLTHVIYHSLQGLLFKISMMRYWRQILVIF